MTTPSLRWLLSDDGPLKTRIARAGVWLLLGHGMSRVAGFVKVAVVARLLSPNDFGLMGIALVVLQFVEHFSETGLRSALIRHPGDTRSYLDTVWTIQALRSLGIAAILLIGAPLGAWFFANPLATPIIQCVGLVTILRGLANPATVYLRKELDFKREMLWKSTGVGAALAVTIPLAFAYRNVWALVLSTIAGQAAETLASYWIHPYRPRPRLEREHARELIVFGRWVSWNKMVVFVDLYLDSLIVGKLLGATLLGFYLMAYQFSMLPMMQMGIQLQSLMFPAFSKLQDQQNLRRAFLRTLDLTASVLVPIGCFLSVFADALVRVVLGEQWVPIAPSLRILAWAGVAATGGKIINALFLATGHPKLQLQTAILKVLILTIAVYPFATTFGIAGVASAVTASMLLTLAYQVFLVTRTIRISARELAGTLRVAALGSAPFLAIRLIVSPTLSLSLYLLTGLSIGLYLIVLVTALRSHFGVRSGLWLSQQS